MDDIVAPSSASAAAPQIASLLRAPGAEGSLTLLQNTLDAMRDGVALWDDDMKLVLHNTRFREMVLPKGFRPLRVGEHATDFARELFNTDGYVMRAGTTPDELATRLGEVLSKQVVDMELQRANGVVLDAEIKRTALGGYLLTVCEMADGKHAEDKEAHKLEIVNDAVQGLEEGFSLWDANFCFLMSNDRYMEIVAPHVDGPFEVGRPAEEIMAECFDPGIYDIPDGVSKEDWITGYMQWARGYGGSIEVAFKDGRTIIVTAKETELGGVLITAMDVTEQRDTEARRLAAVNDAVGALDEGFALLDQNLNFTLCNPRFMALSFPAGHPKLEPGTPAQDAMRQIFEAGELDLGDLSCEDFTDQTITWIEELEGPREYHFHDGRITHARVTKTALGGYLVLIRDITEERNSETKAREMMLEAIQSLDEGLALLDKDLCFVHANEAWYDMFYRTGTRPEIGSHIRAMVMRGLDAGTQNVPDGLSNAEYANRSIEAIKSHARNYRLVLADGRVLLGSSHETELDGYLISFRDVTDIEASERRMLTVLEDGFEALSSGIVLYDSDARFVFANEMCREMWFAGMSPVQPGEHLRDLARRSAIEGAVELGDTMTADEYGDLIYEASRTHQKNVELHVNGRTISGTSHKTQLGAFLLEFQDITARIQAEQELAEQREIAHQNEKLSALGELLAGVAHELNNPLSVVFGYSQMLQGKVSDPVLAERIDLICQSAERAAKIVRTFLAMARQRPTKIEHCSINEIVTTALEVSSYSLKSNGTQVRTEFGADVPPVSGDFDQLAQVFSNLIVNAGHAVESQREAGEIVVRSFLDTRSQRTVVEIRDNGPGIAPEIQPRIFEPFFTTKDVGEGTGVGLAFSHRIVNSHEGALDLKSKPGQGTSFFVRLPPAQSADVGGKPDVPVPTQPGRRRVLVIDDEAGVAKLIADLLTDEGFTVTKTTSPRAALHLAGQQEFDVALSDFKMPDMDGQAFHQTLSIVAPGLARRTGFITGDAMSAQVREFLSASGCPHIEKPIIRAELLALVADAASGEKEG